MAYSVGYVDTQGIYGGCTEVTEVSGTGMEVVPNSRTVGYRYTELTEVSGTGIKFVPNLTGVFGNVLRRYRTLGYASVGYLPSKFPRYSLVRTLPNIPLVYPARLCSVGCAHSGYENGSLRELTKVPGRYANVVPVPVPAPDYFYKGIPVPRVLCHGHTELKEVAVRVLPGKIPRVWFCTYPTEHNGTNLLPGV